MNIMKTFRVSNQMKFHCWFTVNFCFFKDLDETCKDLGLRRLEVIPIRIQLGTFSLENSKVTVCLTVNQKFYEETHYSPFGEEDDRWNTEKGAFTEV